MPAFHTFTDTLAAGGITGAIALSETWQLIEPVYPDDWVNSLELRLYCTAPDWQLAIPVKDQSPNAAAVPGPEGLWLPISIVRAEYKVWVKAGSGNPTLYWILEGKTTLGNV